MKWIYYFIFFFLVSCSGSDTFAPVTDISGMEAVPRSGVHRVASGETLYSIAFRYGLDYRTLAERNNIQPPYTIQKNQLISLRKSRVHHAARVAVKNVEREPEYAVSAWKWPTRGKVIKGFSANNKGVNIAGAEGEAVYAAAAGKVVYSGNGLRGYGNLIIIKHNNVYLSAYAHCRVSLVRDGEWVRKGQKIAEMGSTGTDTTMLHFEVRKAGKPVDPMMLFS
jgi:lipoprotein NlpD